MSALPLLPASMLAGLRHVFVAVLDREGALVEGNDGFRRFLRVPAGDDARPVVRLLKPSLDDLLDRLDALPPQAGGWRLLHEGRFHLGTGAGLEVSVRGTAQGHEERILLMLEEDRDAYDDLHARILRLHDELEESGRRHRASATSLERAERDLLVARIQIRTLRGLLPLCAQCRKVRNDDGYWERLEDFAQRLAGTEFSHGICDACLDRVLREGGA